MTDKTVPPAAKQAPATRTAPARTTRTKAAAAGKVAPVVPAPTKAEAKKDKKAKPTKMKVIRDSFTLPQDDYAKLAELKQVCLKSGLHVKKSELVRAGLRLLSRLDETQLHTEMSALEKVKTGRPKAS